MKTFYERYCTYNDNALNTVFTYNFDQNKENDWRKFVPLYLIHNFEIFYCTCYHLDSKIKMSEKIP